LPETFGVGIQDAPVLGTKVVLVEVEVYGIQLALRLIHTFAVLAHLTLGTIGIRLALAPGDATVILALEIGIVAVFVRLALPLALVILAHHARLATAVAVGINFAFVGTLFVVAEWLFLGTVTVFDALDTPHVLALGPLFGTIRILAALLALPVAARHQSGIALLGSTIVCVTALGKVWPAPYR
jgi:hypothetical protein